ncbi:MAG: PIG-L family deacetylase [Reyranella sp.]|uniref:PIG-L family deacetylase n=1 Tax=Reyranella sp. TaxID=1929291 RepID=UPI001212EFA9|nr:PIG-L family deacetylase [Reyranella sp.]TAJ85269.1 MAG: PIG-L family deacetylase [Reyranella sp.]TBR30510.1 MAG: PIG-L family deacetylase [Reyranella sp.]
MKLRIDFRPSIVVALLAAVAFLFWLATRIPGVFWFALPFALFYSVLVALAALALLRTRMIERWMDWDEPGRLLILAPHEDDCVISAGGLGLRNGRLGGITRVVYLARDETPDLPERREAEARGAWRVAGLGEDDLLFFDLMPPLKSRDPEKLRKAAAVLRGVIDEFNPTVLVMPAFEGGHVHHDMVAALIDRLLTPADRFAVFEAPEYSPYASFVNTPHRILALAARWLFGLVAYNGPPDGVDGRTILKLRMSPRELADKRRMLAAFVSQNAPSLVTTRGYPDRLIACARNLHRRRPFDFDRSYLRLVLALRRRLPARLVDRILPVQLGTIGRMGTITDWDAEWGKA